MKNWHIILGFGLLFGWIETAHYGWNWSAQSDAEMICDGITLLLYALAWLTRAIEGRPSVAIHNH